MKRSESPNNSPIIRSDLLVVNHEEIANRQSMRLAVWTFLFLLAGIFLGWNSADTEMNVLSELAAAKDRAAAAQSKRVLANE